MVQLSFCLYSSLASLWSFYWISIVLMFNDRPLLGDFIQVGPSGFGRGRERSPIEWGEISYLSYVQPFICTSAHPSSVHTSVCTSVCTYVSSFLHTTARPWISLPICFTCQFEGQMVVPVDGQTNGRTNIRNVSPFCRTLFPLWPRPCFQKK